MAIANLPFLFQSLRATSPHLYPKHLKSTTILSLNWNSGSTLSDLRDPNFLNNANISVEARRLENLSTSLWPAKNPRKVIKVRASPSMYTRLRSFSIILAIYPTGVYQSYSASCRKPLAQAACVRRVYTFYSITDLLSQSLSHEYDASPEASYSPTAPH